MTRFLFVHIEWASYYYPTQLSPVSILQPVGVSVWLVCTLAPHSRLVPPVPIPPFIFDHTHTRPSVGGGGGGGAPPPPPPPPSTTTLRGAVQPHKASQMAKDSGTLQTGPSTFVSSPFFSYIEEEPGKVVSIDFNSTTSTSQSLQPQLLNKRVFNKRLC